MASVGKLAVGLSLNAAGFSAGLKGAARDVERFKKDFVSGGDIRSGLRQGAGLMSMGPDKATFEKLWGKLAAPPRLGMAARFSAWAGQSKAGLAGFDQAMLGGWGAKLLTPTAGVIAGLAFFGKMAHDIQVESDQIVKAAKRLGLTTVEYEKLGIASRAVGLDSEAMARGIEKLVVSIGKARMGKGAEKDLFAALGLDPAKLGAQLSAGEKLAAVLDVSRKISGIKDESVRAAIQTELFGKAGAELDPILQEIATGGIPKQNVPSQRDRETLADVNKEEQKWLSKLGTWYVGEWAKFARDPLALSGIDILGWKPVNLELPELARLPADFKFKPGKGPRETDLGATGLDIISSGTYGSQAALTAYMGAMAQGVENPIVALLRQIANNTVKDPTT